jgi:hypothetical protein
MLLQLFRFILNKTGAKVKNIPVVASFHLLTYELVLILKKLKAFSNFIIHSKNQNYETVVICFFNPFLFHFSTCCPGTIKIGFLQHRQQPPMDFVPEQQPGIVQNNY